MKLLANFNADDMSAKLETYIKNLASKWNHQYPITLLPSTTVDHLTYELGADNADIKWNHWHKQQALLKSIKLLSKSGIVEIVSLTKTKTTFGFIHLETNVPFKLVFDEKFNKSFSSLLQPARFIKYGDWRW